MSEANLAHAERGSALAQTLQLLAGADAIGGGAGHVAAFLEPGDRAVEALLVVLIGLGEVARHPRELELEHIDAVAEADQPLAELGSGHFTPTPQAHAESIRTSVCRVKVWAKLISFSHHLALTSASGPTLTPSSQPVNPRPEPQATSSTPPRARAPAAAPPDEDDPRHR